MKKPAYYKEGVPYDVRGQVITALSGGSTQVPLVTDLGGGKFQFASQGKACYLMSLSVLGTVWVMDRNDGYGVAACFATEDEKRAAVSLLSGLLPAPKYTPELLEAAMRLLGRPDAMALNSGRWGMQFAVAGRGVMLLGEKAVSVLKVAISRAVTLLTASTAGPMVAAASTLLFSAAAGQGSDRVPGRDREAMLALNAKLLSQNGVKIAPGSTSVDLPVRGSLVYRNGQLALELLKTGDGVPKAVRVLMAERDEATGLDRIRVPSVAGEPERTILINPVAPPAKSSSTGNDEPAPVTPKHTGTDITPVESITVTTTPVDDHKGLQDFIYWRPDAAGTGVEPVYVVLSDPLDSDRFTRKQLDKKYLKHAKDFGIVDTRKNSETLTKFRDAIITHLEEKETFEKGTYLLVKDSKVFFNPKTNNVVVMDKDNKFISGWKLDVDSQQYKNYVNNGVLR
ncbi:S-type pyocin domain-containing protein [Pectobacterium odoriferum]|uniref:S-type pyocin domain-containing protein n=1 Tax=Pectobacterium odoriferum TaxID=78398 RepID=UPI000B0C5662|nr:S-type pyocin domain-containing protein [Pectobacterium odoriferum]